MDALDEVVKQQGLDVSDKAYQALDCIEDKKAFPEISVAFPAFIHRILSGNSDLWHASLQR